MEVRFSSGPDEPLSARCFDMRPVLAESMGPGSSDNNGGTLNTLLLPILTPEKVPYGVSTCSPQILGRCVTSADVLDPARKDEDYDFNTDTTC